MLTLTIKTDNPLAEIGLFDTEQKLDYFTWQADRQLAETIHQQIHNMLDKNSKQMGDLQAIIVYKGPGSFTGLRIGISVANAIANGLGVPIVSETGKEWIHIAAQRLVQGENQTQAIPEYGALPNITQPRK